MSPPNLPPDISRELAAVYKRIAALERRNPPRGVSVFNDLDDVDAINPNDKDVATYVESTGKVEMKPGGFTVATASYVDPTGVNLTNGGKLQWVLDTSFTIGISPNADLLDLSDPERPTVIDPGYFTFDMNVQGDTEDEPNQRIQWLMSRGSDVLIFGEQGFPTTAANPESNAITFSFSYPCLAGDELFVQLQTAAGSSRLYSLFGSVKRLA